MIEEPVSVVLAILNEGNSIVPLLESLLTGTRIPDEIVIIDGGSTDGTVERIEECRRSHPGACIRLTVATGTMPSQARNMGIRAAEHDIIAVTDGGCVVDRLWLQEITEPMQQDSGIQVVGGNFQPVLRTRFQRLASPLLHRPLSTIQFSPSSRSIAFRKGVWERVGGYPEWLLAAEDTVFNREWRRAGASYVFRPNALIYREPPASFHEVMKKTRRYARGDGEASIMIALRLGPLVVHIAAAAFIVLALQRHPLWWGGLAVLALAILGFYLRKGYVTRNIASTLVTMGSLYLLHWVSVFAYLRGTATRLRWSIQGTRPTQKRWS